MGRSFRARCATLAAHTRAYKSLKCYDVYESPHAMDWADEKAAKPQRNRKSRSMMTIDEALDLIDATILACRRNALLAEDEQDELRSSAGAEVLQQIAAAIRGEQKE
jgi:hypothetical protein